MKGIFNNLPAQWILLLAIIAFVSYITGLSFWWCLLAYIGIMFLIEFAKSIIVIIVLVVGVSLALFFGLLTL